jgi:16S rRNA (cytidine1402-2'-O)-methyltransferase
VGTLYLVATPIGNLEDITLRALRVLREVPLIAAEDTRRTRKLLTHYEIRTPLVSYHEHSNSGRRSELVEKLAEHDLALVTDAGTPGISDPGYGLVQSALEAGWTVVPIPGPSAPLAALVASGLPTDRFMFVGYLPRKAGERRKVLASLRDQSATLIFFEVPHRVLDSLQDLADVLGDDRQVAVARELTKIHEQFLRGRLADVLDEIKSQPTRGEYTLIVEGQANMLAWTETEVRSRLAELIEGGASRAAAARAVAGESGWTRNQVYNLGLEES